MLDNISLKAVKGGLCILVKKKRGVMLGYELQGGVII